MQAPKLAEGECSALSRTLDSCPDPAQLYATLCDGGRRADTALLETADVASQATQRSLLVIRSALRVTGRGRFVYVDALNSNGACLLPWLGEQLDAVAKVDRGRLRLSCVFQPVGSGNESARLRAPSPMEVVRRLLFNLHDTSGQPSTIPLMVGTFGYDLLECYEPLPVSKSDPLTWPDLELLLPDRAIWIDAAKQSTQAVAYLFGGDGVDARYGDATQAIGTMVAAVKAAPVRQRCDETPSVAGRRVSGVETDLDDQAYADLVVKLKEHIVAGDVFQIVPSRTFSMSCADPLAAYRRLRRINPSPYMFFIHGTEGILLGASPETAVKVDGKPRSLHVRPLAGTRPRGRTSTGEIDLDLDSRLEAELRLNEKEVAEHMMLVDLARNDVARVSKPGTRRVERLLEVVRYSHVMHLSSHVIGELHADLDALHAYVATMNMGTLVGAPKVRAAQLLREYETTRRGAYGGGVGYVAHDGQMDTAIVIRSAIVKDGRAYVRAGAGVVFDSDPIAEADETRRKAEAMLAAIAAPDGGVA